MRGGGGPEQQQQAAAAGDARGEGAGGGVEGEAGGAGAPAAAAVAATAPEQRPEYPARPGHGLQRRQGAWRRLRLQRQRRGSGIQGGDGRRAHARGRRGPEPQARRRPGAPLGRTPP